MEITIYGVRRMRQNEIPFLSSLGWRCCNIRRVKLPAWGCRLMNTGTGWPLKPEVGIEDAAGKLSSLNMNGRAGAV